MLTSELYCPQEIWDMDNAIVLEFVNVYSISSMSPPFIPVVWNYI